MNDPIWQFSLQATHALIWGGTLGIAMLLCVRAVKLRTVVYATTILTLLLVTLGAYVRLTDAGLGCPDWPGCYGKLSPAHAEMEISDVHSVAPAGPVSQPKAWREMLHRYLASLVGAMVLAIVIQVFMKRRRVELDESDPGRAIGLPLALLGIVILQGLFGKWTVTLLLKPAVVTMHACFACEVQLFRRVVFVGRVDDQTRCLAMIMAASAMMATSRAPARRRSP
jgi:heme A synthase